MEPAGAREYVHVCIDDASRIAFSRIYPDQTKYSAVAFLNAAIGYYQGLGILSARAVIAAASQF